MRPLFSHMGKLAAVCPTTFNSSHNYTHHDFPPISTHHRRAAHCRRRLVTSINCCYFVPRCALCRLAHSHATWSPTLLYRMLGKTFSMSGVEERLDATTTNLGDESSRGVIPRSVVCSHGRAIPLPTVRNRHLHPYVCVFLAPLGLYISPDLSILTLPRDVIAYCRCFVVGNGC